MTAICGILITLCLSAGPLCDEPVLTGLDNIESRQSLFASKRVGIITNHTAYNRQGRFIVDLFDEMQDVSVTALFAPEHGFLGAVQDGQKIKDDTSPYGLPVYSLYGKHNKPTPEMLENVDILVFDIQDIGARYYTYISTMAYAIEAAAESGKPFVVLDRPNPINALTVQGNVLDPKFSTFVGLYPIPVRHGMTIGELARLFNGSGWLKNGVKADLTVIPMTCYDRAKWFDQTGLKFIPPSPNMTSLEAAAIYPGTCLFEGTNLSEGRGTDHPFLQFGAPWINADELTAGLNNLALPGLRFEPVRFTPTLSKFADQNCFGVRITITDRDRLDPFWSSVDMVNAVCRMYPEKFEWKIAHFDRLCGTDQIRIAIIDQKPIDDLKSQAQKQIDEFLKIRQKYLLYPTSISQF